MTRRTHRPGSASRRPLSARGARARAWRFPSRSGAQPRQTAARPRSRSTSIARSISANVVTSAAKGVTTVQEAPAIITIITADEIKARGFRWIEDAYATVPGWMNTAALGNQVPAVPMVRGVEQSALLLRDGVSLFDPFGNNQRLTTTRRRSSRSSASRSSPAPAACLWGANSFLGIVNVIMKDAEDVNGARGLRRLRRRRRHPSGLQAYALFGKTFLDGKLKIFQHVSYENYLGPIWNIPQLLASTPAPQPSGPAFFGPAVEPPTARSWMVDARRQVLSFGPVSLYYAPVRARCTSS